MKAPSAKPYRIRLNADAYYRLRRKILERDGWRCQHCGSISGVEVHHTEHRSQGGSDCEENLIALCSECHALAHKTHRSSSRL